MTAPSVVMFVAGVLFGGTVVGAWPWLPRRDRPQRHEHDWKRVSAARGTAEIRPFGALPAGVHDAAATLVLSRCDCGAVKTATVDGHWTLAQLEGT